MIQNLVPSTIVWRQCDIRIWVEQHAEYVHLISVPDQPGWKRMYHYIRRAESLLSLICKLWAQEIDYLLRVFSFRVSAQDSP